MRNLIRAMFVHALRPTATSDRQMVPELLQLMQADKEVPSNLMLYHFQQGRMYNHVISYGKNHNVYR